MDALYRFRTLGKATVTPYEGIPCFTTEKVQPKLQRGYSKDDGEEWKENLLLFEPEEHTVRTTEWGTYRLLHELHEDLLSVPSIPEELKLVQETNDFCRSVVARLSREGMTSVRGVLCAGSTSSCWWYEFNLVV